MIAKLVVWAPTRQEAIARMRVALGEFRVDGIRTTIPFHQFLLGHSEFQEGCFSTKFVEKHQDSFLASLPKEEALEGSGLRS